MLKHLVHACWSNGSLHLWGERAAPAEATASGAAGGAAGGVGIAGRAAWHPGAAPAGEVLAILHALGLDATLGQSLAEASLEVVVPSADGRPVPSPRLAHERGGQAADAGDAGEAGALAPLVLSVPVVRVAPAGVMAVLEALETDEDDAALSATDAVVAGLPGEQRGPSLEFYCVAARFVRWLLSQQRFVPGLVQEVMGGARGLWQPWLADEGTLSRLRVLLAVMPPSARAGVDAADHRAWPILEDFLVRVTDAACRAALAADNMHETIEGRSTDDPQVAWMAGLLTGEPAIAATGERRAELVKRVRGWIGQLEERGSDAGWRLCLRLAEPVDLTGLSDFAAPGPGLRWVLSLHLQSVESPEHLLDAADIWVLPTDGATVGGRRVDKPAEVLLAELGRAARIYRPLEEALSEGEPTTLGLNTEQAYEFLREHRAILVEQGFGVIVPDWWDSPAARLGVRLKVDAGGTPPGPGGAAGGSAAPSAASVGLASLVNYSWQVSIGQTVLTLAEFERLAQSRSPLVMIGGRWVEVRPEDVQAAVKFIRENPGGQMELGKAIRLAYATDPGQTGLPVVGMEASGWLGGVFAGEAGGVGVEMIGPPPSFVGSLRPYQLKGLSWLSFLSKFGLGACLADDMGLGKTIQFLAMLLRERETPSWELAADAPSPKTERRGPTLLVVPMSVVGNWLREAGRFAPSLKVYVHHGLERRKGRELLDHALAHDLVVTTYALANRDRDELAPIPWHRVALDEAQNIKNPAAKQTQAIRSLDAPQRIALTGTPIENRLSELWSIMDFLNPGLLGGLAEFRSRFALPIERYHDAEKARRLRSLVQPFVLRRLKTDPTVIADLPEKVETKDYCYLTPEQANLYEATVKRMLASAEQSEGIQRRGIILAGLVKLKQVCNHPALYLKDLDPPGGAADPSRSGKCVRLVEMLDEVLAGGGQALVFTQFRQMGTLLAGMLRHELDREVQFLHGGTPAAQRDSMVARFQKGDGSAPIFLLSLKAGGIGLNLTAANHVFHFDRWWNPAVESQATDRAYRIGQTRTVQVHKFVVAGTLEERIDQMIEQKSDLAENVIGSGEAWLTELSLTQLRDVLALRPDAMDDEDSGEGRSAASRKRAEALAEKAAIAAALEADIEADFGDGADERQPGGGPALDARPGRQGARP